MDDAVWELGKGTIGCNNVQDYIALLSFGRSLIVDP